MTPLEVVRAFNAAVELHDPTAIAALLTADSVFDSTGAPDGELFEGRDAIRGFWERFFESNPTATFALEEELGVGERVVTRWRYSWSERGHVRGVDLFRVRDGLVAEKLSYVKG
jgi:limonene-1,2-epoxide hydrolase